jgi:hypothetical protein
MAAIVTLTMNPALDIATATDRPPARGDPKMLADRPGLPRR